MTQIPVFVWKTDPQQVGNGTYSMVACFQKEGVHVPFTFLAHSENEYLQSVGEAVPCDGSCRSHEGRLKNFGAVNSSKSYDSYDVVPIIKSAQKQPA